MPELMTEAPQGVLRGWTTTVEDYCHCRDMACGGKILVVGDAAGGVFGLDGKIRKSSLVESRYS